MAKTMHVNRPSVYIGQDTRAMSRGNLSKLPPGRDVARLKKNKKNEDWAARHNKRKYNRTRVLFSN